MKFKYVEVTDYDSCCTARNMGDDGWVVSWV